MLGALSFIEDPALLSTAGTAVPQHLPPWLMIKLKQPQAALLSHMLSMVELTSSVKLILAAFKNVQL